MRQTAAAALPIKTDATLRILQTTDLHMHLLPFDYDQLTATHLRGLANLVENIDILRGDGVPTLLCDTGDFLQGTPLADRLSEASSNLPHPMIAAFNDLKYDAIALGNHDFDYGFTALSSALRDLKSPVLCANIASHTVKEIAAPSVILEVSMDTFGDLPPIKVGLIGLTVPGLSVLDPITEKPALQTTAPLVAAQKEVADLQAKGAEVIVALCHFGMNPFDETENVAMKVADLPGVDAVLAGHTHDLFPSSLFDALDQVDTAAGTCHGTACVMAGAFGSHLGVIELKVMFNEGCWRVDSGTSRVVAPEKQAKWSDEATDPLVATHADTVAQLQTTVATSPRPFSTKFSQIQPDMSQQLLAQARIAQVSHKLSGSAFEGIPILGAAAAYCAGGKEGPDNYINVPAGPMTLRHAVSIYPYSDPTIGLRRNGRQVRNGLEDAASAFAQITPGKHDQLLTGCGTPPYALRTLFGVEYVIDVSAPVGARISQLTYQGAPVADDDIFIVATTAHRIQAIDLQDSNDMLTVTDGTSQAALIAYLKTEGALDQPLMRVWDFASLPDTSAIFKTNSDADPSQTDRTVRALDLTPDGFRRFALSFPG